MTRPTTIPEHLVPVYAGMPVPWVAVWSEEMNSYPIDVRWTPHGVQSMSQWTDYRFGMTWVAVPNIRHGRPAFGMVHSARQRRSMLTPRCQVCGNKIVGDPYWIIPNGKETRALWDRDTQTMQPPVCRPCAATAVLWCPDLVRAAPVVVRGPGTPIMASGDHVRPDPLRHGGTVLEPDCAVRLDEDLRVFVLGRMIVVAVEPREEISLESLTVDGP